MSEPGGTAPRRASAGVAVQAAVREELEVMAAVEAVAGTQTGWPLGVLVVELRRELDRRAVTGRSVQGAALVELAHEVMRTARHGDG